MNGSKIILVSAVALVLILLIYLLSGGAKSYNWNPRINEKAYEPYDVGYFKDVLSSSYGEDYNYVTGHKQFEEVIDSGIGTMLYLNSDINLSIDHTEALLKFVERGNTAFYSSDNFPEGLISEFSNVFLDVESDNYYTFQTYDNDKVNFGDVYTYNVDTDEKVPLYIKDSIVSVSFPDSELSYDFSYYQKDTLAVRNWLGIPKTQFDYYNENNSLTPRSYINDSIIDCFSIKKGQGELYIQLNPLMFGNIFFVENEGFKYAQEMTTHFSDGELYFNKRHHYVNYSNSENTSNYTRNRSPFTFIFKHKSLTWALYTLIILAVLYIIFGLKRKLPILKHFDHPKNSSIRYVRALSSFYKSSGDYTDLCKEMIRNFEHFLRKRYNIKTDLPKEDLYPLLSKKSGISISQIKDIYKLNMQVEYGSDGLKHKALNLHNAIDKFHKNCK